MAMTMTIVMMMMMIYCSISRWQLYICNNNYKLLKNIILQNNVNTVDTNIR